MIGHARKRWDEWLPWFVAVAGVAVCFGWFTDTGWLKSIHPSWVTMKFSTAVSFALSGTMLALLHSDSAKLQGVGVGVGLGAVSYMVAMGFDVTYDGALGLADAFVEETPAAVMSHSPGVPSVCTMVCFALTGAAGVLVAVGAPMAARGLFVVVGIGALLALCGYGIGWPPMYCYFDGHSSAMAVHTALLFGMLAASGVRIGTP